MGCTTLDVHVINFDYGISNNYCFVLLIINKDLIKRFHLIGQGKTLFFMYYVRFWTAHSYIDLMSLIVHSFYRRISIQGLFKFNFKNWLQYISRPRHPIGCHVKTFISLFCYCVKYVIYFTPRFPFLKNIITLYITQKRTNAKT